EIVSAALDWLREKIRREPIGFELLPPKFTLTELQSLYEAILQTPLDKRNFRKKLLAMSLLVPLAEKVAAGRHRPAQLFRFDPRKYRALTKRGFNFEI
ncbi:MAG TPA: NUDIX hydrolase, partial [Chthoniobacteraceae bacterium]